MPTKVLWIRRRHARLRGAAALARARVAALAPGREVLAHARARVDLHRLADDQPVLDELTHVEARVRHADVAHLIRVQPEPLLDREPSHVNALPYSLLYCAPLHL